MNVVEAMFFLDILYIDCFALQNFSAMHGQFLYGTCVRCHIGRNYTSCSNISTKGVNTCWE